MEVTAVAKNIRQSPRKVRVLLPQLTGQPAETALLQLKLYPQAAAGPISKLLKSAVANAEHNYSLDRKTLVIKRVVADEGPSVKRYQPASRGRGLPIKRRTTHLSLVLEDLPEEGATKTKRTAKVKKAVKKVIPKRAKQTDEAKATVATDAQITKSQQPLDRKPTAVAPRKTDRQTGRAKSTHGQGRGK